jgi:hypothetical protein
MESLMLFSFLKTRKTKQNFHFQHTAHFTVQYCIVGALFWLRFQLILFSFYMDIDIFYFGLSRTTMDRLLLPAAAENMTRKWQNYDRIWRIIWTRKKMAVTLTFFLPELVFTKLILQILYWISEIVIHSHIFILDLPAGIDLWNLYYYILAGNWVVYSLFEILGKCRNAWKL